MPTHANGFMACLPDVCSSQNRRGGSPCPPALHLGHAERAGTAACPYDNELGAHSLTPFDRIARTCCQSLPDCSIGGDPPLSVSLSSALPLKSLPPLSDVLLMPLLRETFTSLA